eukprot:SAG22_NODE_101_length_20519_cov_15.588002_5_plen_131_part_00
MLLPTRRRPAADLPVLLPSTRQAASCLLGRPRLLPVDVPIVALQLRCLATGLAGRLRRDGQGHVRGLRAVDEAVSRQQELSIKLSIKRLLSAEPEGGGPGQPGSPNKGKYHGKRPVRKSFPGGRIHSWRE